MSGYIPNSSDNEDGRIASHKFKNIGAVSLACILLSSLFVAGQNAFPATLEDVLAITDNTNSTTPKTAATEDGANIYVTWQQDGEIYIIKTTDGGASFGNTTNISNSMAEASTNPQIAVSGSDNVLVVWEEAGDIFLARSINAGDNFALISVSNDVEPSTNPQIAVSESDEVYIVWEGETDNDDSEVFLIKTTDGGASFGNTTNISNSVAEPSTNPQIAVSGSDNVLVVWEEAGDIFISVSINGGLTFDADNLSQSPDEDSTAADIHSVGSDVLATWQEYDTEASLYRMAYKVSADNGLMFTEDATILITADSLFITPSIASGTGGFFVSWEQFDSALLEGSIFVSMANDDLELSCPAEIAVTNDVSAYPQLTTDGTGGLFSVWEELVEEGEGEKVIFAYGIDATSPYITQTISGNIPVFWGMESSPLTASGMVGNFDEEDSIKVNWGDGQISAIPIGDISFCSWTSDPHVFGSEAVGPVEIVSSLIDGTTNATKDVGESFHVDVLPHDTELVLHQVPSIQVGNNITITGILKDLHLDGIVEGAEITFDGTGADTGLSGLTAVTDEEGNFIATGSGQPADPMTRLKLQAHFAGTQFHSASDSEVSLFNVAGLNATVYNVTSVGSNVNVELADFNATVQFEEIVEGGQVFVEDCVASDTVRFLSLDDGICLVISPALQLADGSNSVVTLSYSGQGIADGYTINDIDIFLEDTDLASSFLDISQSRDTLQEVVSGQTTSFGNFLLGLAIHESSPENALRKQAFIGENIEIVLRDIAYSENVDATIALDKSGYRLTDTAIMTIEDKSADLDPTVLDSVSASVQSESDADGIIVQLMETENDSGTFTGTFTFTSGGSSGTTLEASAGDELSVTYSQANWARFKGLLHEVVEAGVVDVYDVTFDPESTPFSPLGHAVALELVDTQLSPADDDLTLTLSYANADLAGSNENYIRMFQGIGSGDGIINQWFIISEVDSDTDFTVGLDTDSKTVTADAQLFASEGIFVLGYEDDSVGGDGGGLGNADPKEIIGYPIASIRSSSSGGSGGGGGGGGGGSGGGSSSSSSSSGYGDAFPGSPRRITATLTQSITSESSSTVDFDIPGSNQNLEIDFTEITSEGGTMTITVIEISQFPMVLEGTISQTVGDVYDIKHSSDLTFDGLVYVMLPYDEAIVLNSNSSENDVRVLHFDTSTGWEDKTVSIDTVNNTVTAALSSFSPVIVAIIEDGSFGSAYIEANPLSSISVSNPTSLVLQGETQDLVVGQPVGIQTTIRNMERNSQSYTYIVQILDEEGQVVHLDWADIGLLGRSQEKEVTSRGWTPAEAGGYTGMVFIWEQNLQSTGIPTPLAPRSVIQDLMVIESQ